MKIEMLIEILETMPPDAVVAIDPGPQSEYFEGIRNVLLGAGADGEPMVVLTAAEQTH